MVIARATADKDELLLLGLSRENVRRLTDGQPMHLKRETHGDGIPEGWEIVIVFGETEQALVAEFRRAEMISPETKIHKDPRL
jgi:hypothetical protein